MLVVGHYWGRVLVIYVVEAVLFLPVSVVAEHLALLMDEIWLIPGQKNRILITILIKWIVSFFLLGMPRVGSPVGARYGKRNFAGVLGTVECFWIEKFGTSSGDISYWGSSRTRRLSSRHRTHSKSLMCLSLTVYGRTRMHTVNPIVELSNTAFCFSRFSFPSGVFSIISFSFKRRAEIITKITKKNCFPESFIWQNLPSLAQKF